MPQIPLTAGNVRKVLNPTTAVGGLFILSLQRVGPRAGCFLNPTNAVGGSFILSLQRVAPRARCFLNLTNAVGGLFILGLRRTAAPRRFAKIPPTQLVDRS